MTFRRIALALALATMALSAAALPSAAADSYPTKPIRMIVPYPAGGVTDTIARMVGQDLSAAFGQPVVTDNRPGANGSIGIEAMINAPADGYTMVMGAASTHVINPLLNKLNYDPLKATIPISMVAETALLLVIRPDHDAKNVPELIAWLKAHPDKTNYGSYGEGSISHLAGEMMQQMSGLRLVHIPYKGAPPAQMDVMAGDLGFMFSDMSALGNLRGGKLRALAITGPRRSQLLPEVPTMAEAGMPGFEVTGWFAFFVSPNTPPEIVERLSAEVWRIVGKEEIRKRLTELGLDPPETAPAGVTARMLRESAKWQKVIAEAGFRRAEIAKERTMPEPVSPISLDFFQDPRISGLLGSVVALSGEVLVLKAEVRRLTQALETAGVVDAAALERAGDAPAVTQWIAAEAEAQSHAVLRPMLKPDEVIDVRHLMETER